MGQAGFPGTWRACKTDGTAAGYVEANLLEHRMGSGIFNPDLVKYQWVDAAQWSGMLWTAYELANYRLRRGPDLEIQGMQADDYVLLWARDPQFIWLCMKEGRELTPQTEGRLTLKNVPDGRYDVEWRETTTNDVLLEAKAEAREGRIQLDTPAITRSAAARLDRIR